MNYLLRAEAVNLDNFVYDTNKIQPTRGGSFLLLDSVQQLYGKTIAGIKLKKITTGASIGLYSFSTNDNVEAEKVVNAVHTELTSITKSHATFAVACIEDTGDFKADLLKLQTKVRWQQYQQPTLILPDEKNAKEECAFDGVRPGVVEIHLPGKKLVVSDSVDFRINAENKKLREKIYSRILNEQISYKFTKDIEKLANHKDMGNLNNKIAFIYLDGNKFTKIRNSLCDNSTELTNFSDTVETARSEFLAALLAKAEKDKTFKTEDEEIRFETLLWGGDELEIIVPAWQGWAVLHLFFDAMKDVHFKKKPDDEAPLTHAGGIVFCNCKAPIREIRRMAHELSDMAKDAIKPAFETIESIKTQVTHEKHDTFHFLVLESFDTVGGKVKFFAQNYFGKTIWQSMMITQEDMGKLTSVIKFMKDNAFPRNKIFDIVRAIKQNQFNQSIVDNALADNTMSKDIVDKINIFLGNKIERWFVISELWDYVCVGGAQ
ncbi:MAG: hypothetical protein LLG40_01630 [Deltaproteobacteria bacterium]|nr:hypothetical protein [Deltaproteobacteria bacterium]